MQKLEENQLQNEIEGLLALTKSDIPKMEKEPKEAKQGSQSKKSNNSSQGIKKSSKASAQQAS